MALALNFHTDVRLIAMSLLMGSGTRYKALRLIQAIVVFAMSTRLAYVQHVLWLCSGLIAIRKDHKISSIKGFCRQAMFLYRSVQCFSDLSLKCKRHMAQLPSEAQGAQ